MRANLQGRRGAASYRNVIDIRQFDRAAKVRVQTPHCRAQPHYQHSTGGAAMDMERKGHTWWVGHDRLYATKFCKGCRIGTSRGIKACLGPFAAFYRFSNYVLMKLASKYVATTFLGNYIVVLSDGGFTNQLSSIKFIPNFSLRRWEREGGRRQLPFNRRWRCDLL